MPHLPPVQPPEVGFVEAGGVEMMLDDGVVDAVVVGIEEGGERVDLLLEKEDCTVVGDEEGDVLGGLIEERDGEDRTLDFMLGSVEVGDVESMIGSGGEAENDNEETAGTVAATAAGIASAVGLSAVAPQQEQAEE